MKTNISRGASPGDKIRENRDIKELIACCGLGCEHSDAHFAAIGVQRRVTRRPLPERSCTLLHRSAAFLP